MSFYGGSFYIWHQVKGLTIFYGKKQTLESQIRSLARINGGDNHAK